MSTFILAKCDSQRKQATSFGSLVYVGQNYIVVTQRTTKLVSNYCYYY